MKTRHSIEDLNICTNFLKNPNAQAPEILQTLEVKRIRLLLQEAAESIILSDNREELKALKGMYKLINEKYPKST